MHTLQGRPFRFYNLSFSSYTQVISPEFGEYVYKPDTDTLVRNEERDAPNPLTTEMEEELRNLCVVHQAKREADRKYRITSVPRVGNTPPYVSAAIFHSGDYVYTASVASVRSPTDGLHLKITGKQHSGTDELVKFSACLERDGVSSLVRLLQLALQEGQSTTI